MRVAGAESYPLVTIAPVGRRVGMEFTQSDIDSLAQKLAAADLTEGEQAVMDVLVDAAEGEVTGFSTSLSFAPLKPAEFTMFLPNGSPVKPNVNPATTTTRPWIHDGGDTNI